jgi:hypothetical protein
MVGEGIERGMVSSEYSLQEALAVIQGEISVQQ